MAKSKQANKLLDEAKKGDKKLGFRVWMSRLPKEDRQEMGELQRAWQAGELDCSAEHIRRVIAEQLGGEYTHSTIKRWLDGPS